MPVVVVQCGVGMVNAALCAQALINTFSVAAVVNTGIAGSLDASIDIGDVVVANDAVNHIMDVQNLGYKPGQTPGIDTVAFPASPVLRKAAIQAAGELGITVHEGRRCLRRPLRSRREREGTHRKHLPGKLLRNGGCCRRTGLLLVRNALPYRSRDIR